MIKAIIIFAVVLSACYAQVPCHYSCLTCMGSNANNCVTCNTTFRIFNAATSMCDCPVKYDDDRLNLLCTSTSIITNCSQYQTITVQSQGVSAAYKRCQACIPGYKLDRITNLCFLGTAFCSFELNGICVVCRTGWSLFQSQCILKPQNCKTVKNVQGQCQECNPGYYLNGTVCKFINSSDPSQISRPCNASTQYRNNQGECTKGDIQDCELYQPTGKKCSKCRPKFSLNPQNQICNDDSFTCPPNSPFLRYVNVGRTCLGIDLNCKKHNSKECTECQTNYRLDIFKACKAN